MTRQRPFAQVASVALATLWVGTLSGFTVVTGCAQTGAARPGVVTGPGNVTDLVGMRAQSLDTEMSQRGYSHVGGHKTDTASITTWWNPTSRECVRIETREGRVAATESDFEGKCQ